MQSTILGYVLAAGWLPLLATTLMVGATWVIWYYAIGPGVEGSAAARLCTRAPLACYIVPAVWRDCVLHGVAAITLTGGPDIMLFIRERRRNQRAEELRQQERKEEEERRQQEKQADAERYDRVIDLLQNALEQANTERRQAEERAAEERRLAEERYRQDQQRAEERYRQDQQRAEERAAANQQRAEERAAANQQALLNTLTAVLARNGNGAPNNPQN